MSPEIYRSDGPFDGHAIDLWACGVILFIMITGVPPFDTASDRDQRFRIVQSGGMGRMLRGWGMTMSDDAVDLIQRMLRRDPAERLEIEQVREGGKRKRSDESVCTYHILHVSKNLQLVASLLGRFGTIGGRGDRLTHHHRLFKGGGGRKGSEVLNVTLFRAIKRKPPRPFSHS